jgi:predicted metalloprotease with PDZ domain
MAYLDYRLQDVGGLKAFLRAYFKAYNHTVITQEHFKNNLEFFSGLDLTEAFETYIWGKNEAPDTPSENHIHKSLSETEIMKML